VEDIRMVVCTIKGEETKNEAASPNNPSPHAECVPECCRTESVHQKQGNERNQNVPPHSFLISRQNMYHPVTDGDKTLAVCVDTV
jgi:hypothetical protein